MQIIRYSRDGQDGYGRIDGDEIYPIANPFTGVMPSDQMPLPRDKVLLLAPATPTKILAAAVNYQSHAIRRDPTDQPELFYKPPSSVCGPGDTIQLPPDANQVEAEGELVAVMGRRTRNVSPAQALESVLGFSCGVDVSAREWQRGDRSFWRGKGCDTFSPLGPVIATDLNPANLTLVTRINGDVRQETTTEMLLFDVAELIVFAARHITLEPGDLIFTGTPGTTPEIVDNDTLEVEISGIGTLRNPVATIPDPTKEQ